MIRGREIRGLPVFAGRKKEEIGRVQDIVVGLSGQMEALVIVSNKMLAKNYFVECIHVKEISKKGVIVPNKANLKKRPKNLVTIGKEGWVGSKVFNTNGKDEGTVSDVIVEDGQVTGLEISQGIVEDLSNGRIFLPWDKFKKEGKNFIKMDIYN